MDKYAFIYEIHPHVHDFCGPFNSHKEMMEHLTNLAVEDEAGIGDGIQEQLCDDESPEEVMYTWGIKIFKVSEEKVDCKDIYNRWKMRAAKYDKKMREKLEEEQEKHDREEYERLKARFEGKENE